MGTIAKEIKNALQEVYEELHLSDYDILILKENVESYDKRLVDRPPSSPTYDIIYDLKRNCKISYVNLNRVFFSAGSYKEGDMSFLFSANNITEDGLSEATHVQYGDKILMLISYSPRKIIDDEVVQWEVIARSVKR